GLAGQARPLLDHVAPHDASVVRGPRRQHDHAPEVLYLQLAEADVLENEAAAANTLADRVRHRLRLLVDLLEHESLVAVLLRGLVIPVDLELLALARAVRDRGEAAAVLGDDDDLPVFDQLDAACLAQESRNGRGEEHL